AAPPPAEPIAPAPAPSVPVVAPSAPAVKAPPPTAPPAPVIASAHPPAPALVKPAAPAATPPAIAGGIRLQLGAMHSEEAARQAWERVKQANADLLGGLTAAWPRADLGARGIFYRLQAGPIADEAKAERICRALKQRQVGCILVRP
ncbi:MAG: SPOR domain-containing protein, partial [Alphaproteobacteria bacterium]|nr:SPOR domain-containing protein [Alphaproteobacteria bacterium]